MVAVMFMSVALVALLCVLAYTLAIYALPFMLGLTAAQFAYQTGSGLIGAGLVGLFSAGVAFGVLAVLFETIRSPAIRLIVALVFTVPAAVRAMRWSMASPRKPCRLKFGDKSSASSAADASA